jgi:predicted nucleic acid-binding protein
LIVYVLDASALLRFLDKEAGWELVADILAAARSGSAELEISAIQWGEVAGAVRKKAGPAKESRALDGLAQFAPRIQTITGEHAIRAAALKVDRRISYADAFALDLAMGSPNRVLVTADYGFKSVDDLARIEFLPAK